MEQKMEKISSKFEIKSIDETGVVEGYASVFSNVDHGGDIVAKGAFSESLKRSKANGQKIKMLWQHNQDDPIGVWNSLEEDDNGLFVKGKLIMEVKKAREAHALMKSGVIDGLSIGYTAVKSKRQGNARLLEQVNLFEVSLVTFPMNESASITSVKSSDFEEVVEKMKSGGKMTVREFEKLAKGLGLSNSEAERSANALRDGLGDPVTKQSSGDHFIKSLHNQFK